MIFTKKLGIIISIIALILFSGCGNMLEKSDKDLIYLTCSELKHEIGVRPYTMIGDNEQYVQNILKVMELKDCKLGAD